jgi:hypothetical protein
MLGAILACGSVYYYLHYHGGVSLLSKSLLLTGFIAALFALRVVDLKETRRLAGQLLHSK